MGIPCQFALRFGLYTCVVENATITKKNVRIESFKGEHQQDKGNDDATSLIFSNNCVKYFPRHLRVIFPNLTQLSIIDCGLSEISRSDLVGLEDLTWLYLHGNEIKSLSDDLFADMPKLRCIYLSGNRIEFASLKLLESFDENLLIVFDLEENTSINIRYDQHVLPETQNAKHFKSSRRSSMRSVNYQRTKSVD